MWKDYEEKEAEPEPVDEAPGKVEYIDVIISDVRTDDFGFSVQILNTEGTPSTNRLV
jgi:staphylococcal nuclease domain-containing protein 1